MSYTGLSIYQHSFCLLLSFLYINLVFNNIIILLLYKISFLVAKVKKERFQLYSNYIDTIKHTQIK